ncbi:unnamed protein product [Spirodela intermedia]|uniref:Uncharacterized protein n=1 Tax=Spirodela intermedia TaxID=51605 RepID=A0A7I8KBH5_SPIIN|nr:unnamed protein product [Spirodela intermedia]
MPETQTLRREPELREILASRCSTGRSSGPTSPGGGTSGRRLRRRCSCRRWRDPSTPCRGSPEPAGEWVRHSSRHQRRQVDHHPVNSHVAVGRHQRRRLRAVDGLVEGPGTLARALSFRVADPDVGKSGPAILPRWQRRRPVRPAPAHAEPFHRNISGGEHHGNRAPVAAAPGGGGKRGDIAVG